MTAFFGSVMVIGILLILYSFAWIAFDKKKSWDFEDQFEEKKTELINVINDAEQMLTELNKFSDYIVSKIDEKNGEIFSSIEVIESKISKMKDYQENMIIEESPFSINSGIDYKSNTIKSDLIIENIKKVNTTADIDISKNDTEHSSKNEKVIPLRNRHKEVVLLSKNGLNDTEIAKKLNMGKGEIQLILGVSSK